MIVLCGWPHELEGTPEERLVSRVMPKPVGMGTLLDGLGADHILWGTDTPVIGPPHWQIQGFQTFTIPAELIEKNKYQQLTPEVKRKIFGENVARLFSLDIKRVRQGVEGDLLYKLRIDGAPLPIAAHKP